MGTYASCQCLCLCAAPPGPPSPLTLCSTPPLPIEPLLPGRVHACTHIYTHSHKQTHLGAAGQTRTVHVTRIAIKDSVEERILELQVRCCVCCALAAALDLGCACA